MSNLLACSLSARSRYACPRLARRSSKPPAPPLEASSPSLSKPPAPPDSVDLHRSLTNHRPADPDPRQYVKAHDGIRTRDLFLTKEVLYRLSYMGIARAASLPPQHRPRNGAGDGIRTRDPELGRLALYQLSYSRSPPAPSKNGGEGRIRTSVGVKPADLQSAPFGRSGTSPCKSPIGPSRWRESNSQPTDYKSVALPLSYIGAEFGQNVLFILPCRSSQEKGPRCAPRLSPRSDPDSLSE